MSVYEEPAFFLPPMTPTPETLAAIKRKLEWLCHYDEVWPLVEAHLAALSAQPNGTAIVGWLFKIGDRVTKRKGSAWTGLVVGTYSTLLTPEGYAIESENEPGSVQIYPVSAIEAGEHKGAAL